MKITGYRSLTTSNDWGRPVGDANGVVASGITEVPILILETDGGIEGIGLGQHADIARLFPAVDGQDPRAVSAIYDAMLAYVFKTGHAGATYGAIGAIDMALWDLKAKMAEEPLWRTLGGADRHVRGYASGLCFGLDDAGFDALYGEWAARGFAAAKIKGGIDIARDIDRLARARDLLSANSARPALMLDVNEAWNRKQAIRNLAAIEAAGIDLSWIEEPVRRWDAEGHAAIARTARCGVATGENLTGLEQYAPLFRADAVDIVQAGSIWGITHFLRVAIAAHSRDLPVSPVAYHANPVAHAAAAVPNMIGIEVQELGVPFGLDIDQQVVDGGVVLGDRPGLGILVDEAAIARGRAAGSWGANGGPHRRARDAGLRLVPDHGAHAI